MAEQLQETVEMLVEQLKQGGNAHLVTLAQPPLVLTCEVTEKSTMSKLATETMVTQLAEMAEAPLAQSKHTTLARLVTQQQPQFALTSVGMGGA